MPRGTVIDSPIDATRIRSSVAGLRLAVAATMLLACAESTFGAGPNQITLDPSLAFQTTAQPPSGQESDVLAEPTGRLEFGQAGMWYWTVGGGVGISDDSIDPMGQLGFGTFLADDFEFNLTVRGWYFAQDSGPDAGGGSLAIGFRWHFVNKTAYSVYTHFGIGMLYASDDVPPGGTQFNFTPTVGIGSTIRLDDRDTRLDLGLRWHHISNATTGGSDDNPARDGIMLYMALIFPF